MQKRITLFGCIFFSLLVHMSALSVLDFRLKLFFHPLTVLMQIKTPSKEISLDDHHKLKKAHEVVPIAFAEEEVEVLEKKPSISDAISPNSIYISKEYFFSKEVLDKETLPSISLQSKYLKETNIEPNIPKIIKHKFNIHKRECFQVFKDIEKAISKRKIQKENINDKEQLVALKPSVEKENAIENQFEKVNKCPLCQSPSCVPPRFSHNRMGRIRLMLCSCLSAYKRGWLSPCRRTRPARFHLPWCSF